MILKARLALASCLLGSGMIAGCGVLGIVPMKPAVGHAQAGPTAPAGDIPAPVQAAPILPKPKPTARPETYSVVVSSVKVQELLFALARDAKLNIDIHPGIGGNVTINAIDQTLQQLLSRIAKQVDMRYELDGANLFVLPDSPYLRVYKIDYVNMQRDTTGSISVSSQISAAGGAAAGGGGAAAGGTNSSTAGVRNTATNHFWDTLVKNVQDILHETDKLLPSAGAPTASAASSAPAAAPAAVSGAGAAPAAASASGANVNFREAASVIANAETGVLIVRATSRQHEKLQEFLDQVLSSAKRQVLIEATIAEVTLNNQYQQGIDWSFIRRTGLGNSPAGAAAGAGAGASPGSAGIAGASGAGSSGVAAAQASGGGPAGVTTGFFALSYALPRFNNLLATVRLLESFGNVRVLSSPRISVLNNQTAILKVVDNQIYFTIRADQAVSGTAGTVTTAFTTTPNTVPVGFVMNVTAQISDIDTVLLNVRPSVTRITGFVNDPNPSLANPCGVGVAACLTPAIVNPYPLIQTREMESLIKVNSGEIAVMGGLIQDRISDVQDGVPGLNRLPGIGGLFESRNLVNSKTELVIFMRPIVIRDASIEGDYRGYRTYLPDDSFMSGSNPGRAPLPNQPQGPGR
jgi:MSHA biogenesis protein MshL